MKGRNTREREKDEGYTQQMSRLERNDKQVYGLLFNNTEYKLWIVVVVLVVVAVTV